MSPVVASWSCLRGRCRGSAPLPLRSLGGVFFGRSTAAGVLSIGVGFDGPIRQPISVVEIVQGFLANTVGAFCGRLAVGGSLLGFHLPTETLGRQRAALLGRECVGSNEVGNFADQPLRPLPAIRRPDIPALGAHAFPLSPRPLLIDVATALDGLDDGVAQPATSDRSRGRSRLFAAMQATRPRAVHMAGTWRNGRAL